MSESELSFRDQCAISAMRAVLSNASHYHEGILDIQKRVCARYAFDMADLMVSERKERARIAGEQVEKIIRKRKGKVD